MSFGSLKETYYLNPMKYHGAQENTLSQSHEISSWCLYWEYLLLPAFINSNPIIGLYDQFRVSPISQSLLLILAQTLFSQGWESMQYSSLVNHENWLPCIMIHHRSCSVCIIYANGITMGNPSWRPRQVIPPSRRWSTIASTGLLKPWTNYGQLIYLQGTHNLYLLCNS